VCQPCGALWRTVVNCPAVCCSVLHIYIYIYIYICIYILNIYMYIYIYIYNIHDHLHVAESLLSCVVSCAATH